MVKFFLVLDFVGDVCKVIVFWVWGVVVFVIFDDFYKNLVCIICIVVFGFEILEVKGFDGMVLFRFWDQVVFF